MGLRCGVPGILDTGPGTVKDTVTLDIVLMGNEFRADKGMPILALLLRVAQELYLKCHTCQHENTCLKGKV